MPLIYFKFYRILRINGLNCDFHIGRSFFDNNNIFLHVIMPGKKKAIIRTLSLS